jgi:hypothetical protein
VSSEIWYRHTSKRETAASEKRLGSWLGRQQRERHQTSGDRGEFTTVVKRLARVK